MTDPTTPDFDSFIAALDDHAIVFDGDPVGRIGLGGTLYYDTGHLPDIRRAIGAALDRYVDLVRGELRWYGQPVDPPGAFQPARVGADRPDYGALFGASDTDAPFACAVGSSGTGPGDWDSVPGAYLFAASLPAGYDAGIGAGRVRFHFPFGWERRTPGAGLWSFVRMLCDTTRPAFGSAGMIFHYPLDDREAYGAAEAGVFRPWIDRFPGVDATPAQDDLPAPPALFSINWLTIVSDRLAERGGLGARLSTPPFDVDRYPGGLLIQAGPAPLACGPTEGSAPEAYRAVAKVLAPILVDAAANPFAGDDAASDAAYTHRFDRS